VERAEREARSYESDSPVELASASRTTITDKEKHEEALSRVRQLRSEQEDEGLTLGRTFARDADKANAFSKLARYETSIERHLHRALHELERRQAARRGGNIPAPLTVDVEVSGMSEGIP
jgi:hypothetical protein